MMLEVPDGLGTGELQTFTNLVSGKPKLMDIQLP